MKAFLTLLLSVFISILLIVDVYAGDSMNKILKRGELIVGTSADSPPMIMKTKDDNIIGYDADVAQLIASSMKVRLKLVQIDFNNLIDK